MKILHVCEYVNGGMLTYLNTVLRFQQKEENIEKLMVVASRNKSGSIISSDRIVVKYFNYKRSIFQIIRYMIYVASIIKKQNPDIVHVHSSFAGFIVRMPLFFNKQKPKIVYCPHGWSFLMKTSKVKKKIFLIIERILSTQTEKIINISTYEHNQAIRNGLNREKLVLIENGIDSTKDRVSNFDLKINPHKINLLFVGRFDYQKGLDLLLKYLYLYHPTNIQLYLIGDRVLNNKEIEIPTDVINLGHISQGIDSYYESMDAIIIPSRWEGFGLVAIEAMKNRKAIIVSNQGALPYFVMNNNGFVFDINNLNSLNHILVNLSKKELIKMGENGYQIFFEHFTSQKMNTKIIQLYNNILFRNTLEIGSTTFSRGAHK